MDRTPKSRPVVVEICGTDGANERLANTHPPVPRRPLLAAVGPSMSKFAFRRTELPPPPRHFPTRPIEKLPPFCHPARQFRSSLSGFLSARGQSARDGPPENFPSLAPQLLVLSTFWGPSSPISRRKELATFERLDATRATAFSSCTKGKRGDVHAERAEKPRRRALMAINSHTTCIDSALFATLDRTNYARMQCPFILRQIIYLVPIALFLIGSMETIKRHCCTAGFDSQ